MTDPYKEMLSIFMNKPFTDKHKDYKVEMNAIRSVLHDFNPFWVSQVIMRMYENNVISLQLPPINFSTNDYDTSKYVMVDWDNEPCGYVIMSPQGTPTFHRTEKSAAKFLKTNITIDIFFIEEKQYIQLQTKDGPVAAKVVEYEGSDFNYNYYSVQWPEETGISGDLKLKKGCDGLLKLYINSPYPEKEIVERADSDENIINGLIHANLLEEFRLTTNNTEKISILGLALYRLWVKEM